MYYISLERNKKVRKTVRELGGREREDLAWPRQKKARQREEEQPRPCFFRNVPRFSTSAYSIRVKSWPSKQSVGTICLPIHTPSNLSRFRSFSTFRSDSPLLLYILLFNLSRLFDYSVFDYSFLSYFIFNWLGNKEIILYRFLREFLPKKIFYSCIWKGEEEGYIMIYIEKKNENWLIPQRFLSIKKASGGKKDTLQSI